jgi:hypothetical protein
MRSPTLSARTIVPSSRTVESIRRDPQVSSVASGSAHASASTQWDYTVYPPGHFQTVWASPPVYCILMPQSLVAQ